ncbi:hypothetical protein LMH73_015355 [Vibrio splendidus]|nr:hypothetical protein [Vibrio splendidus]MCC4881495.1 hypothetical protein [Vibrio splendidus]
MSTPLNVAQDKLNKLYEIISEIEGLGITSISSKIHEGGMLSFNLKVTDTAIRDSYYADCYTSRVKEYGLPILGLEESLSNEEGLFRVIGWVPNKKKSPILVEKIGTAERFKMSVGLFTDIYHSSLKEPL